MSDSYEYLIPRDPEFEPTKERIEATREALRAWVGSADEITVESLSHPRFFDPGENWEGVHCPHCNAELDEEWGELMGSWDESNELVQPLACCGRSTSLNDLNYGSPCGFARFALVAQNPERPLPDEACGELGAVLGAEVRIVRQHL